jgi:hypothetical protein
VHEYGEATSMSCAAYPRAGLTVLISMRQR